MKRKILKIVLGLITKGIIKKYNPKIIGVTGSVGKTSTKNTIFLYLNSFFNTRKNIGNLNTEFGVPLVFIGKEKGGGNSIIGWIKIILLGIKLLFIKDNNYPEIVVVEMGADKPGDISYLTKIAKPNISVVTLIGETPVHLENYNNINDLILEKSEIVKVLGENDYSVLNFDDSYVRLMKEKTKSKVIYFGASEASDIKFFDLKYNYINEEPRGISFKVEYNSIVKEVILPFCYSNSFGYSIVSAIACGIILGINFEYLKPEIFKNLKPEKGRMNLIKSKKGFFIIDDTYNSSPASAKMAIDSMSKLKAQKRIIALGDMKELGQKSDQAHQEIGEIVFGLADFLITVGESSKKISEKSIDLGFNKNNAFHFNNSEEAIDTINNIIGAGDLLLVKGSRSMKMEKIIEKLI